MKNVLFPCINKFVFEVTFIIILWYIHSKIEHLNSKFLFSLPLSQDNIAVILPSLNLQLHLTAKVTHRIPAMVSILGTSVMSALPVSKAIGDHLQSQQKKGISSKGDKKIKSKLQNF